MANPLESHILEITRIDSAYRPDAHSVAGMDEQLEENTPDIVALGLAIIRKHDFTEPTCPGDVLATQYSNMAAASAIEFSNAMLSWAMRPKANGMFLIGLARAFLDFEGFMASREDFYQATIDRSCKTW